MKSKSSDPNKGAAALPYVSGYIRQVNAALTPGSTEGAPGLLLHRKDEGGLFLSGAEAKEYAAVVSRLFDQFVKCEEMSRRTVEQYLQDAIFASLDLQSRSQAAFDQRLGFQVEELYRRLTQPVAGYTCYVPLSGLGTDGLPYLLGRTRIVLLNPGQVRRLSRTTTRTAFVGIDKTDSWGKTVAVTKVQARDADAAKELARREARNVVDVLNFFSDMVPFNHGWAYLPGEAATVVSSTPIQADDGSLTVSYSREGPPLPFSLKSLRDADPVRAPLARVKTLMRLGKCSPLASLLMTSIAWAGRASVDPRREQAFLLFAIALETLMVPETKSDELTYRLSVRVAHLLGQTPEQRLELSKLVRDLYGVRSKIVHSGSYEVTDEDLGRVRLLAKQCILRALLHRRIRQLTTPDEFRQWCESRVLG